MTQHKCKWYFTVDGSAIGTSVNIALVDMADESWLGAIEIDIEALLCFLEAAVNCEDWYEVKDDSWQATWSKPPLLMELEDTGAGIDDKLIKLTGSYSYGKRKIFNREPLVTIEHTG